MRRRRRRRRRRRTKEEGSRRSKWGKSNPFKEKMKVEEREREKGIIERLVFLPLLNWSRLLSFHLFWGVCKNWCKAGFYPPSSSLPPQNLASSSQKRRRW